MIFVEILSHACIRKSGIVRIIQAEFILMFLETVFLRIDEANLLDYATAKRTLLLHGSGMTGPDGEPLVEERGFVGMLRPYRELIVENLHIVLEAMYVVGERIHVEKNADLQIVEALWCICNKSRRYGLHPKGILQSNRLITTADVAKLEEMVGVVERTVDVLFAADPVHYAVSDYAEYALRFGFGQNASFFVPYLLQDLDDQDEPDPVYVIQALGLLHPFADSIIPALQSLSGRRFGDWCHDEVQSAITNSLRRLSESQRTPG